MAEQVCPIASYCEFVNPEAPPCGDFSNLSPLPTAESMCSRALRSVIEDRDEYFQKANFPAVVAKKAAELALLELDLGLSLGEAEDASRHLDRSAEFSRNVEEQQYMWFKDQLPVMLLNLYRPLLTTRAKRSPDRGDLVHIREGLSSIFESLATAPLHDPGALHITEAFATKEPHTPCFSMEADRQGAMVKMVGLMLAARQNILLYPAGLREAYGRGVWISLNHDAYALVNGEKVLTKFSNKPRMNAGRKAHYDNSLVYVDIRHLIDTVIDDMQEVYSDKCQSVLQFRRKGGLLKVGLLLAQESDGRYHSKARLKHEPMHQTFLDNLSIRLRHIFMNAGGVQVELPERASVEDHTAYQQTGKDGWNVLPAKIAHLHRSRTAVAPELAVEAAFTQGAYLRHAQKPPSVGQLKQYIDRMRRTADPTITATCIGAYLDLARHPETTSKDAVALVEASEVLARGLISRNWSDLTYEQIHAQHYADIHLAYVQKYKAALAKERFGLNDETRLYLNLLEAGRRMLVPGQGVMNTHSRGLQFEAGIHLLNARHSIRNGQKVQSMWPSLPREDSPHRRTTGLNLGWDMAASRGNFLVQDGNVRYVQCKSTRESSDDYDPSIIVIAAKEDFSMAANREIIDAALLEASDAPVKERTRATATLNRFERILLDKLGFND